MIKKQFIALIGLVFSCTASFSGPEQAPMAVWVNEAIVATYSYSYATYLQDQKQIGKYFTADAWMNYSKALIDSKLPEAIQKNHYTVSAVATEPPVITNIRPDRWQATMGLLVVYQNPQYKQQQNIKVSINFAPAASGLGVRGYNITSFRTEVTKPPCECVKETDSEAPVKTEGAQ